ncbi:MAG TPA: hypothetical protein VF586_09610, partial [Pyrinomonadaceae bacterium]
MRKKVAKPQGHTARPPAWFDARVVGLVLAVKALLLLYGVQAYVVWKNEWVGSFYGWLSIWNRWDAPHYLDIARTGYVSQGVEARWIVFFPLYPWLVRAAALVLRDELPGAFFVSGVASVAAGLLLYGLARADGEPEEVARASVFYLIVFPTAYFLHIGYNESLFLALALGSFVAARGRRWRAAGLLGFLAALTRINGALLLPALAFEAWDEYRGAGRRARAGWLWLLLVGAGFGVYLLINWWVLGDPRAFLKMQGEHWFKSPTWPWVGVKGAWHSAWGLAPSDAQMVGWQEFFFIVLGLGLTGWAW